MGVPWSAPACALGLSAEVAALPGCAAVPLGDAARKASSCDGKGARTAGWALALFAIFLGSAGAVGCKDGLVFGWGGIHPREEAIGPGAGSSATFGNGRPCGGAAGKPNPGGGPAGGLGISLFSTAFGAVWRGAGRPGGIGGAPNLGGIFLGGTGAAARDWLRAAPLFFWAAWSLGSSAVGLGGPSSSGKGCNSSQMVRVGCSENWTAFLKWVGALWGRRGAGSLWQLLRPSLSHTMCFESLSGCGACLDLAAASLAGSGESGS